MANATIRPNLRGTQSLVSQMGWLWSHPTAIALEVLWRSVISAPLLFLLVHETRGILTATPVATTSLANINWQNPWAATVQVAAAWAIYSPAVAAALHWLVPVGFVVWSIVSGIGRNLVLRCMDARVPLHPFAMMVLQATWLAALLLGLWIWWNGIAWAAQTHLLAGGEPDLVGFFSWLVFLSLAGYMLWACISWVLSFAVVLLLMEQRSAPSALAASFRAGRSLISKLIELNFIRGIARLALLVMAMVISAAPLPFNDLFDPNDMKGVWALSALFYILSSDYFHVLRLKGQLTLWEHYRGSETGKTSITPQRP